MYWVHVCVDSRPFLEERVQDPAHAARVAERFRTEYPDPQRSANRVRPPASRPAALIVLWRVGSLRCVVVMDGNPIGYEVHVQRNGEAIVKQTCDGLVECTDVAELLRRRFGA